MNWKLLLVLGVACIGLAMVGLFHRTVEDEGFDLTILHTNDVHAHYDSFQPWGGVEQGGVARLKTVVDQIRNEEDDVLLLDAGDQFQGTLFFTVGGADVVADVMNELGYDAMTIGNHEFDRGPSLLADFIWRADFPVLSANTNATNEPALADIVFPYAIYEFDMPVGIIGLTTERTATASSPGESVRFEDAIRSAQASADELEALGIDIVIALTHLGFQADLGLAGETSGIDVIVGGHSHTYLDEYPAVVRSSSGEPVLVVTAQDWGRFLGRLDVAFGPTGVVEGYEGELIFIDASIEEDEGMAALLDEYRPQIDALMSQVVGQTNVFLGSRDVARSEETVMGNLICDAMLWKTAGLGATVAIQNGGGIRSDIVPGEITMGQILEVLPFGNQITLLTITGAELMAAIENGVAEVEDRAGAFPQVGGMRYTFDPALDAGSRVTTGEIFDAATRTYSEIDPAASYTVATNNYLADGGDGYDYSGASDRYDTGWLLSDALAEYIEEMGSVSPAVEGRITIAGAAEEGASDEGDAP